MLNAKNYLIEMLEFYLFKLKKDACTMDEINAAAKALEENMPVSGTIKDFAEFYNKPESAVRTVLSRKVFDKPRRILLHPFYAFAKSVPLNWRNNRNLAE